MHGLAIDYPTGWLTDPATEPATTLGLNFGSPDVDYLYDGQYEADLFLAMASQPLAGKTPEAWVNGFLDTFDEGCTGPRVPVSVAGTNGLMCGGDLMATATGGRGYFVRAYTGSQLTAADAAAHDENWFRGILATLQLRPQDALDAPVPASASPSS